jgi:hypothetical protein
MDIDDLEISVARARRIGGFVGQEPGRWMVLYGAQLIEISDEALFSQFLVSRAKVYGLSR